MQSEYFPKSKIRGRHKSYKYWFTGLNTQVLRFEQKFNNLYATTFTNPKILTDARIQNNRESPRREYQAAVAGSSNQGAEGQANAVGASAADYLYSKTDIANCELNIVGDPAWLQQGEAATGISSTNYNYNPFNDDGGINFDAQEIIFDLQWNPGVDYDLTGTGLANPNVSGEAQAIYTYKTASVVSRFNRGKFEQTIQGVFIDLLDSSSKPEFAAATTSASSTQADVRRIDNATDTVDPGVRTSATNAATLRTALNAASGSEPTERETAAANTPTATLTNPPQPVNATAEQVESTPAYQAALAAGAPPALAAAVSQQSLGAAAVGTTPIELTPAYQFAIAAGATPEAATRLAQQSPSTPRFDPMQKIRRET